MNKKDEIQDIKKVSEQFTIEFKKTFNSREELFEFIKAEYNKHTLAEIAHSYVMNYYENDMLNDYDEFSRNYKSSK